MFEGDAKRITMGCGSSSKVETIFQSESKSYSRNTPAKQRENGSAEPEQRRPTPKSRGSSASSSNESHDKKLARRKTSSGSRRSAGSARKTETETEKTDVQVISSTSETVDIDKNTDENEEKEIHTRVNMINTNDIKESHTTKDEKHEEISGLVEERRSGSPRSIGSARKTETEQTDVQEISSTGEQIDIKKNIDENEKDEIDICVNIINTNVAKVSDMERAEKHEERAKIAEERRSKANREDMHNREIEAMQLAGIDVEDKVEAVTSSNIYTIDDKVNHNTKVGARDWFIYGRNVYSVDLMLPLVKVSVYSRCMSNSDCFVCMCWRFNGALLYNNMCVVDVIWNIYCQENSYRDSSFALARYEFSWQYTRVVPEYRDKFNHIIITGLILK